MDPNHPASIRLSNAIMNLVEKTRAWRIGRKGYNPSNFMGVSDELDRACLEFERAEAEWLSLKQTSESLGRIIRSPSTIGTIDLSRYPAEF